MEVVNEYLEARRSGFHYRVQKCIWTPHLTAFMISWGSIFGVELSLACACSFRNFLSKVNTYNYPEIFRDEFSQAQRWPSPQAPIYSSVELLKSDFWRWFHLLCRIWERGCSNTAAVNSPQYWSSQCWVMLRAVTARDAPLRSYLM